MTLTELIKAMDDKGYSMSKQQEIIGIYNQRCSNFWEGRILHKASPEMIAAFRKAVYEPTLEYINGSSHNDSYQNVGGKQ